MICQQCQQDYSQAYAHCPYCGAENPAKVPSTYAPGRQPTIPAQQYQVPLQQYKNEGNSIASMVLGICSILIYPVGIILGILAIFFWKKGKDLIERNPYLRGSGMGIAGLVCGIIGLFFSATFWILIIVAVSTVHY